MTIAIGLATVIYIAVSLGVLGTLGVDKVIEAGPTAIAVAAQPVLGDLGYWLMLVTALFATSGATNAGLYPASGLTEHLTSTGQWPTGMGGKIGPAPVGLLVVAVGVIAMILFFDLNAIASIGSAVALLIFGIVSFGHLRIRADTGANLVVLVLAVVTVTITFLTFAFTTLIKEPASIATLVAIVIASALLDVGWSRSRQRVSTASG
jgi:hypothetical protein